LSSIGPVAGGIFASNMGAGLTAGSMISIAQSCAMTGAGYIYGGVAGGVAGGVYEARSRTNVNPHPL
jgi:hypothetical protein